MAVLQQKQGPRSEKTATSPFLLPAVYYPTKVIKPRNAPPPDPKSKNGFLEMMQKPSRIRKSVVIILIAIFTFFITLVSKEFITTVNWLFLGI